MKKIFIILVLSLAPFIVLSQSYYKGEMTSFSGKPTFYADTISELQSLQAQYIPPDYFPSGAIPSYEIADISTCLPLGSYVCTAQVFYTLNSQKKEKAGARLQISHLVCDDSFQSSIMTACQNQPILCSDGFMSDILGYDDFCDREPLQLCPDGSYIDSTLFCEEPITCSDGSIVSDISECQQPITCSDGSIVSDISECQQPITCLDGSIVSDISECQQSTKLCMDGSIVPINSECQSKCMDYYTCLEWAKINEPCSQGVFEFDYISPSNFTVSCIQPPEEPPEEPPVEPPEEPPVEPPEEPDHTERAVNKQTEKLDGQLSKTNALLNDIKKNTTSTTSLTRNTEPTDGAKSFWESDYPNGITSLWDEKTDQFSQTEYVQFLDDFNPNLPNGQPMDLNFCFNLGAMGNYGCHALPIDSSIWAAIRIFILVTAGFLCRALIFGG
jgi:hypothetical protein